MVTPMLQHRNIPNIHHATYRFERWKRELLGMSSITDITIVFPYNSSVH